MSRRTLVLCGNGASAVLLVCALARQAGKDLSIVVIGKNAQAGRGVAVQRWAQSFAPRNLYGAYLSELLDTTLQSNPDLEVRFIQGEVKSLIKKHLGWIVA
ncbi:MAG: FAD/NAD(P)-binding protein, partial [Rhizomicrobium sp.]